MKTPAYWGKWFVKIGDSEVKQTNLNVFLQLGLQLQYFIDHIHIDQDWANAFITSHVAREWLIAFINETAEYEDSLHDSRASVQGLLDSLSVIFALPQSDWKRPLAQAEYIELSNGKDSFEKNFERERHNVDIFVVLPKGVYSTRLLIEKPQNKFPEEVRSVFSDLMLYDLSQAGRCLAFEIPTAVAFHTFRATEEMMLLYYKTLAKQDWPYNQHDWGRYITELNALSKVSRDVTTRLEEIRKFERNPSIHPDAIVSLNRAPILFELCSGVIYTMAEEVRKHK